MKKFVTAVLLAAGLVGFSACNGDKPTEGDKPESNGSGLNNNGSGPNIERNADGSISSTSLNNNPSSIQENIARLPEHKYIVEGQILGGKGYTIYLNKLGVGSSEPILSQDLNAQGEFRFEAKIPQPELMELKIGNSGVIHFIVKPGEDLYFKANIENPEKFVVDGSLEPVYVRDMYYTLDKTTEKVQEVEDRMDHEKDKARLSRMADTMPLFYSRIEEERSANLRKFISKIDTAFTALLATNRLNPDLDLEFMMQIDKKFANRYPYSSWYTDLHKKILTYEPIAMGKYGPEIMGNTKNGSPVRLSSLKGKYVLINFWATFNPESNPDINLQKRLLDKYKAKGFEILNISIDDDEQEWKDALTDKKIPGTNIITPGKFQSTAAQTYLVSGIPATFLLDKEGRIIGKRLNKKLEAKLAKLIK